MHACTFMCALCVCCSTGNAIRETIEFSTDRLVLVSRKTEMLQIRNAILTTQRVLLPIA